jgi:hypothetical protein
MGLYGGGCLKIAQLNLSVMGVYRWWCVAAYCAAFFEQATPFPHISIVLCTFTTHINYLHVNEHQTNILTFQKSYHQLHFIGSRIFDFHVHLQWLQQM